MAVFDDRSAYPHPDEFKVIRPVYSDPEEDGDDVIATLQIEAFRVDGYSASRPGARRAALHEAAKTYKTYHPGYRVPSPFPDEFTDGDGQEWTRVPEADRAAKGDYAFVDDDGEEDFADIEQMLLWDVRPVDEDEEYEDDEDEDDLDDDEAEGAEGDADDEDEEGDDEDGSDDDPDDEE